MNKIEILSPAGSMESVIAAVHSGADAVYVGADRFSARASAKNFTLDELKAAVCFCHARGVQVHLTINTCLSDTEIDGALDLAKKACMLPIDAFIVQDVGFAHTLHQIAPNVPLHASTQMSVHTPKGAQLLYEQGFSRIVLSRELSIKEIEAIRKVCPAELEVFVHGALCMSVSGQCYLSAMLGSRSGNRGQCAQPCRLPFLVKGGSGHDLSLKDLCVLNKLQELQSLGVTSAKIEGRMKRPEYVACATQAALESRENGAVSAATMEKLKSVFSRSGFTQGYYLGNLGKEMFGTRQKEDVTAATNKMLKEILNSCRKERQSVGLNLKLTVAENKNITLTVEDDKGNTAAAQGTVPVKAENTPLTSEKAAAQLNKTGGTPFYAKSTQCVIGDGLTVPVKELNNLRRTVLDDITQKRIDAVKPFSITGKADMVNTPHTPRNSKTIRCVFPDTDIPSEFKTCEYVYVPVQSPVDEIKRLKNQGYNVAVHLPRGMFGTEHIIEKALITAKKAGAAAALVTNIGGIAIAKRCEIAMHGGTGLNVFNTQTIEYMKSLGFESTDVSFELTIEQINRLGGSLQRGAVVYGHLPLMLMRNCPVKNGVASCKECGGKRYITDRKDISFPLRCENGCTQLFNSVPVYMGDKLEQFKSIDYFTMLFTVENYVERVEKLAIMGNHEPFPDQFTRGLYYRGVI